MGIREKLNPLAIAVVTGTLGIAAGLIYWQLPTDYSTVATRAFYTDDDGANYFEDDANKIVPFDHNGKQAYRAAVFECEHGHRVVGLLYRHNDAGKKAMGRYLSENLAAKDTQGTVRAEIESSGIQVKKVGTQKWVLNDAAADVTVTCPSGHPAQQQVIPH